MPVDQGLQLQALLLLQGNVLLQFALAGTQLKDFIFAAKDGFVDDFEFDLRLLRRDGAFTDFSLKDVELVPCQLGVEMEQLDHDRLVALGLAGLPLERTDLAFDLLDQVLDAQEVLVGVLKLAEGFLLLGLELGDAGGFLEDEAAIVGLHREDLGDVALGHDRIARLAHAGAGEELLDVAEAAGGLVQEILGPTVAIDTAGDRHLVVADLDAGRLQVLLVDVADRERNLGQAERLAGVGAVEDDVGHFTTAQGLGGLLAEDPADRVGHVRLAAAVGPDNGGHARQKIDGGFLRERLKPEHGKVLEEHGSQQEAQPAGGLQAERPH